MAALRPDPPSYPKLAPSSAIRWNHEAPEVQVEGTWYALRSIDGLPVERIVAFTKGRHGERWQERFDEDLVQVLGEMGHEPGKAVRLQLRDVGTGTERTLEQAPMTKENRTAIRASRRAAERRPHLSGELDPAQLHRALDDFAAALDERWSYRHANQADFDSAIDALRTRVDAGISLNDFGIELQKIIALGIDGHAAVSGYVLPSRGYLPFLVEPHGDRFVAFRADRTGFLVDGFPYLTKIDGKPLAEWCEAASVLVPRGSPQYVRRQCLRHLRDLDYLRGILGLPRSDSVQVELAAESGTGRATETLPVADRPPAYGIWPRSRSTLLDGRIGYLRLPDMDAATSVREIRKWMAEFRDSAGIIVDVRDNGGGSRDALLLLHSYLAAPGDPPRVIAAACYRLHEGHEQDHLAHRFMYRADAKEWSEAERRAVADFAKAFRPEWQPPEGQFSDWHYLVLTRREDPEVYHYAKQVVVLMNAKCFSATDVFLAGLKGMRNVTLLGTPSGGGSALVQRVALGETPFMLQLGSMASFQADGKLFDGNGVHPDVVVEPSPAYSIGGRDEMLAQAMKRLTAQ
jgi:hypothetical protein